MKRIFKILLPLCILSLFFFATFSSAFHQSLTYDELVNIKEGKNAWLHQTYNIELYHPPLAKILQTAPIVLLENGFHIRLSPITEKNIARSVVIAMGAALLLSVFFVVKSYFGYWQAILALFLLALEPNTITFSYIINTDAMVNLMIFLCFVLLISLLLKPTRKKAIFFAISVGLGLSSKMSFDSFFTISALVLVFYIKKWNSLAFLWKKKFYLLFLGITSLFIIWAVYFFHWSVIVKERNDSTRFSARLLKKAQEQHNKTFITFLAIAEHQKFPLGDYIALYKNVALAKASPNCFFLGSFYPKCYWYFMPVTFLLKTPIPFLIFLLSGVFSMFRIVKKKREIYMYFFIPFAVIFIHAALSSAFPLNRYMLPMYPFAAIVGSYITVLWKRRWVQIGVFALLFWYLLNSCSTFPYYLSYTNELAGPKNIQYLHFWDSNYDWGQSLPDAYAYAKKHNIGTLYFSYYGEDDGDLYGLKSNFAYGSPRKPEVCAFHTVHLSSSPKTATLISISNWYACGYNKEKQYKKLKGVVSDSFLLF